MDPFDASQPLQPSIYELEHCDVELIDSVYSRKTICPGGWTSEDADDVTVPVPLPSTDPCLTPVGETISPRAGLYEINNS